MQLRVIIPKVQPVKLALEYSLLRSTVCYNCLLIFLPLFFFAFFCVSASARNREKHSGGRRRGAFQRQREKD